MLRARPGTGTTLGGVRQLILSPRWILWHLLTLGAVATCLWLAAWQWQRAGSAMGSALNVGYGLQWPLFAVFFAVMWWRFLRMEIRPAGRRRAAIATPPQPRRRCAPRCTARSIEPTRSAPDPPSPGRRPSTRIPALAAYNRMLAELAARNPKD